MTPTSIELYGEKYDVQNIIFLAKKKFQKNRKYISVTGLIREITGHPVNATGSKVTELADILQKHNVLVKKKKKDADSDVSSGESYKPVIQSYMQFKADNTVTSRVTKALDASNDLENLKLELAKATAKISKLEKEIEDLITKQPIVWCLRNPKDGSLVLDQWDSPRFGPLLFSNEDTAHEWVTRHLRITAERVDVVPYNSLAVNTTTL